MKKYLVDKDAGFLLREHSDTGILTDKSRKRLINKATDLLVDVYGSNPKKSQRIVLATAVINLFPFLRVKNSEHGGTVRMASIHFLLFQNVII